MMDDELQTLFAVPRVERFEALSSWIGRLALSQGTNLRELSKYFGFDCQCDVDLLTSHEQQTQVLRACGLRRDALDLPRRVIDNLRLVAPDGGRFLATIKGRPRYRFCAGCLRDMQNVYFPLHWRFVAWRACPTHNCLLEDQCPHCGSAITLPVSMLSGGRNRKTIWRLSDCQCCGKQLTALNPCKLYDAKGPRITLAERAIVKNGQALLAALYYGHFQVAGSPGRSPLRQLRIVERSGLLAHRFEWLRASEVRERPSGLPAQWKSAGPWLRG